MANGVFECNPSRIWSDVYSYNRPDITIEKVAILLEAYVKHGLLFQWMHDGKIWGFWTGIDKPGRLPSEARRGTHELTGPNPPLNLLKEYTDTNGIPKESNGSQTDTKGRLGLGLGLGLGSGLGTGTDSKKESVVTSEPNLLIPEKPPNYAIFRTRFKHVTGFPAGSEKGKVARFEYLASTYGEEAVLDVIAPWAEQVGKDWLKRNKNYAAKNFLEQDCEDFITAPEEKSKEASYAHGVEKSQEWAEAEEHLKKLRRPEPN